MIPVFVVIPSLSSTGPVRGAIALCNGLVEHVQVILVILKPTDQAAVITTDSRVEILSLERCSGWKAKRDLYRKRLRQVQGNPTSISFCLSADVFNFFVASAARIISSVRGNLMRNYRFDYGWPGIIAAFLHYLLLRRFRVVIAMSDAMALQLRGFGIHDITTIGNFVDERSLEPLRLWKPVNGGPARFAYMASLSARKRPELAIKAVREIAGRGVDCRLDIIGDGPLREKLRSLVNEGGLNDLVTFHGHLPVPYEVLQKADYMVLPSESEGIARAALESLFFGIPCILREVDGNQELIKPGWNGRLFRTDEEFIEVMVELARKRRERTVRENLLPEIFRQEFNLQQFLKLISQ